MSRADLAFPPANAPRMIWVFALDVPVAELDRWEAPDASGDWPLLSALGLSELDAAQVEVFPESRIDEYGLVRYLTDANGMSVESVAEDSAKLASLPGGIVLVHSRGLAGREGHFDPAHPARFVGRYHEATGLHVASPTAPSAATRGVVASRGTPKPANPARRPWALVLAAGIVILAIAIVLVTL